MSRALAQISKLHMHMCVKARIANRAVSQQVTKRQIQHCHLHSTLPNEQPTDKTRIAKQIIETRILENHLRAEQHVATSLWRPIFIMLHVLHLIMSS